MSPLVQIAYIAPFLVLAMVMLIRLRYGPVRIFGKYQTLAQAGLLVVAVALTVFAFLLAGTKN